jgi:hypothetical protein
MAAEKDLLAEIRVASPCQASWDEMEGSDQVRFCRQCRKNVYNLSGMSRGEAAALVREKEGRLCVRFYRRRDGTMLTDNCPVGLRAARRWLLTQIGAVAGAFGLLGLLAPLVSADGFQRLRHSPLGQVGPLRILFDWLDPTPPSGIMGDVAWPLQSKVAVPSSGPPGMGQKN